MFERAVAPGELCPTLTPQQGRFIVIGTLRSISEVYISGPIRNFEKIRVAWIETIIRGWWSIMNCLPEQRRAAPPPQA